MTCFLHRTEGSTSNQLVIQMPSQFAHVILRNFILCPYTRTHTHSSFRLHGTASSQHTCSFFCVTRIYSTRAFNNTINTHETNKNRFYCCLLSYYIALCALCVLLFRSFSWCRSMCASSPLSCVNILKKSYFMLFFFTVLFASLFHSHSLTLYRVVWAFFGCHAIDWLLFFCTFLFMCSNKIKLARFVCETKHIQTHTLYMHMYLLIATFHSQNYKAFKRIYFSFSFPFFWKWTWTNLKSITCTFWPMEKKRSRKCPNYFYEIS